VPVAEALRDLLELGYEPQAVADRLGPMIDAIAGELRQLPMNGVVPEAKAALFLGMSIMALRERRYRNTGPIPHFRGRNRKCYYTVSELMRWKEENCCCLECQQLPQ